MTDFVLNYLCWGRDRIILALRSTCITVLCAGVGTWAWHVSSEQPVPRVLLTGLVLANLTGLSGHLPVCLSGADITRSTPVSGRPAFFRSLLWALEFKLTSPGLQGKSFSDRVNFPSLQCSLVSVLGIWFSCFSSALSEMLTWQSILVVSLGHICWVSALRSCSHNCTASVSIVSAMALGEEGRGPQQHQLWICQEANHKTSLRTFSSVFLAFKLHLGM